MLRYGYLRSDGNSFSLDILSNLNSYFRLHACPFISSSVGSFVTLYNFKLYHQIRGLVRTGATGAWHPWNFEML